MKLEIPYQAHRLLEQVKALALAQGKMSFVFFCRPQTL